MFQAVARNRALQQRHVALWVGGDWKLPKCV